MRDFRRRQWPAVALHHAPQNLRFAFRAIECRARPVGLRSRTGQFGFLYLGDLLRALGTAIEQFLQLPIDAVDLAADPLQVGACRRTL